MNELRSPVTIRATAIGGANAESRTFATGTAVVSTKQPLGRLADWSSFRSAFRLGLAQAGDAVSRLPLVAFPEQFDSFESLENVAFCAGSAGGAQTAML